MNSTKVASGRCCPAPAHQLQAQLAAAAGHDQRTQRAHRAAFGGRGHAQEDGAQHQEDQHQRRDQHEGDALGQPRQQAHAVSELVDQRQGERQAAMTRSST
jgi:hypothetical protein